SRASAGSHPICPASTSPSASSPGTYRCSGAGSVSSPHDASGSMSRGRLLMRAVQIAALALVAWFLYRGLAGELRELSWSDIARLRPDPLTLAASFVLLQGVYIAHALLWRTIVRDLDLGDLSLRRTLHVYFAAG